MRTEPTRNPPPVVLTIAGFDPSSGAGATADLHVFASFGLFGTACLTALTVQSTRGVTRVDPVEARFVAETLRVLTEDLPIAGVKVGMLANAAITLVVSDFLEELRRQGPVPIVVDPVLRSSSGKTLLAEDARSLLLTRLLPQATCITPNREELGVLLGQEAIASDDLGTSAAELLHRTRAEAVIVTDGEATIPKDLLLVQQGHPVWVEGHHVATEATHGTGCAFSSALLSQLAVGTELLLAAKRAKRFVEQSLREAPGLGSGIGPMKLTLTPYASVNPTQKKRG